MENELTGTEIHPFYDAVTDRFPAGGISKIILGLLLGLLFLIPHYLSVRNTLFNDWSWFLGVLITVALLSLFYATYTFQNLLQKMDRRTSPEKRDLYMSKTKRILSDRNFLIIGVLFGFINAGMGISFGLPYSTALEIGTILGGYWIAGFVCGMAIWGIYGASATIAAYSRSAKSSFDFTSLDKCGGTRFIGEALVVFSSVTLIVGVMISIYIVKTSWAYQEELWVTLSRFFWIAFPYGWALIALIAPVVPLSRALREYQVDEEFLIKKELKRIKKCLADENSTVQQGKELREEYEFQQTIRAKLYQMRTWPFSLSMNVRYTSIFMANIIASAASSYEWIIGLRT